MKQQIENREPSQHELRIQKSLTKLEVPGWYRKYSGNGKSPGGAPPKREFGSGLAGGGQGSLPPKQPHLRVSSQHADTQV